MAIIQVFQIILLQGEQLGILSRIDRVMIGSAEDTMQEQIMFYFFQLLNRGCFSAQDSDEKILNSNRWKTFRREIVIAQRTVNPIGFFILFLFLFLNPVL